MKTKKCFTTIGIALLPLLPLLAQQPASGSVAINLKTPLLHEDFPDRESRETAPALKAAPSSPFAYPPAPATRMASDGTELAQLEGRVYDHLTRAVVKEVVLELFFIDEEGNVQRTYTGRASSGQFSLPVLKGMEHIAILRRNGYQARAVYLPPMTGTEQSDFFLQPEPAAPPTLEGTRLPATQAKPAAKPDTGPATTLKPEPPVGYYRVTEATSLRQSATHKSTVMLRFQPGDEVEVLEKSDVYWWKVRYFGKTGYVKSFLLKKPKA